MRAELCAILAALWPLAAVAQTQPDNREILNRLERLEQQNRQLTEEVRQLKEQLGVAKQQAPACDACDRLDVQQQRIEDHEQEKVASEHRLQLSITGMALFNAFLNGKYSSDSQYPTTAAPVAAPASGGGSLRQTVVGLKFNGPEVLGGGKVTGSVYLDLFGGAGGSLNQLVRLRVGTVAIAWKNTTFAVGQDKPILAPREPESLAQVGFSPLTGAGNLWLWQPQARLEQRFAFGDQSGLTAQFGLYNTSEPGTGVPAEYRDSLGRARPGYEGRFEFWHGATGKRRIEIAPGFHVSDTHVLGTSVPSRIFSLDWLIRPAAAFDFSGAFFTGENVGVLGGLRQGVTVFYERDVRAIRAMGGWSQFTYRATNRLAFHLYGGQEDDRNRDLLSGNISKNQVYAGNVFFRLGSNVLTSFEYSQTRTSYFRSGTQFNPHYDLALAYLF
jgi:hypothetical protein